MKVSMANGGDYVSPSFQLPSTTWVWFIKIAFRCQILCERFFFVFVSSAESALTGELKISRMSTVVGSAAGNDDLFMFVEKVGKSKKKKIYQN